MTKIQILYLVYHRLTHAQTLRNGTHMDTHMYRDIDTQVQIQRHMHVCVQHTHTHTHTLMCMWEILGNCYFKSTFKSKLTKLVTLNVKSEKNVT